MVKHCGSSLYHIAAAVRILATRGPMRSVPPRGSGWNTTPIKEARGNTYAALPPHSAVRLCLTVKSLKITGGCASQSRRSLKSKRSSGGKAQPFRTVRRPSRTGGLSGASEVQSLALKNLFPAIPIPIPNELRTFLEHHVCGAVSRKRRARASRGFAAALCGGRAAITNATLPNSALITQYCLLIAVSPVWIYDSRPWSGLRS
jgi:hypothetical protein